jgi:hypothetical protein
MSHRIADNVAQHDVKPMGVAQNVRICERDPYPDPLFMRLGLPPLVSCKENRPNRHGIQLRSARVGAGKRCQRCETVELSSQVVNEVFGILNARLLAPRLDGRPTPTEAPQKNVKSLA